MKKYFLVFIFIFTFGFSESSTSFTYKQIQSFNNPFYIVDGYIKLNKIAGFANGKYIFNSSNIKKIDKNLYKVTIEFKKKKKYLKFKHKEIFFILYDKNRFWIKYKNRIYKHHLFIKKAINHNNKHIYKEKRSRLKLKIDKLYLLITFKNII